jgi:hypothetical protein
MILKLGGKVNDWLPPLDFTGLKDNSQLIGRGLVMNALANVYFGAPTQFIQNWLHNNKLERYLSNSEEEILSKGNTAINDEQRAILYTYIEGLWVILWAGSLVKSCDPHVKVANDMVDHLPDLQANEDASRFRKNFRLRSTYELFSMLDIYYRLDWFLRDSYLHNTFSGKFDPEIVFGRRRTLEWMFSPQANWDDVELSD